MSRRHRRDPIREADAPTMTAYLRERIYATFTGLALVLVVGASDHVDPAHAFLTPVLGVVGIVLAGLVSDMLSHLVAHQTLPSRAEMGTLLRIAVGGLMTVAVPALLLLLAWLDVMPVEAALTASAMIYVITLALIGWLAVRRSSLSWPRKFLVLGVLVGLGMLVIAIQILAKSV